MMPANDFQAVLAARRSFFESGRAPKGLVSDTILRSWIRCAGLGMEATAAPRVEALSARELREACERSEQLRRLCRPELESLHADACDTDSVVILTDADGLVLDSIGSTGFAGRAAQVALRPGVLWGESATGTNAIGTALVERRPVEVRGAEHYFAPHRILSCFAAPIVDPQGRVAGALDLSGHAAVPHMHALGMVRIAVDQIEHRLFERRYADCEVLRLHQDAALLGTAREGILVFADHKLLAANRHGLALLGLDWDDLGSTRYSELFATSLSQLREGAPLRGLRGRVLHGRLDAAPAQVRSAPAAVRGRDQAESIVFDAALRRALTRAARMLDAQLPVLLQGETGAGKEVFARHLHAQGSRASSPFVAINCAALPEGLIEAELFGYEDGAFTGARRRGAPGLLRQADGGVLFLDEIGDMPLSLQSRLLRVLQEREVSPLGGGKPMPVDFQLVCATHCDLEQAVAQGRFRSDLYYRIAQYTVTLKALREHPDLPGLVGELWHRLSGTEESLPADVVVRLAAYAWPGNYRELVAVLRTLIVLAEPGESVCVDDLPAAIRRAPVATVDAAGVAASMNLEAIGDAAMRSALDACDNNVSQAARRLGISRSTLYRRVLACRSAS